MGLFNTQYTPALQVPPGWTGSVAGCVPGNTSPAFEAATIQMANYFRTMVGLPTVTLDPARTAGAQSAALMMKAQGDLSHSPPPTWACFTAEGAASAGKSNLFLSRSGASAVAGYMDDEGVPNLGHRRWIIFPRQVQLGTGSTDDTNALDVVGNFGPRPATPEFVSWPPAGFVPFQVVFNTWSFAFPDAELANATITMTSAGTPIQLTVVQLPAGFGDNGISWRPAGLTMGTGVADRTYTVTVSNVVIGGAPRNFTYDVTVIDPASAPPANTPTPTPTLPPGVTPTVTPTATTVPTACAPRPRVAVQAVANGDGRLRVTLTAGANTGFTNALQSITWTALNNATVEGIAGASQGQTTALPGATQSVTFFIRPIARPTAPGQAATVHFTVTDACGQWPTFAGGGPDAYR